jgi:SRSO17 transposase
MLPIGHEWKEGRMPELIETAPKMDWAIEDMEHLVEELRAYHALDSPLFQRREHRNAAHVYRQGLLAALPRQLIEPLVLAVEGVAPHAVRARQSFSSEGRWADARLLHQHGKAVERDLGADDGVLMVDGRDVPKQGVHSAGVKRQDGGELGTRANCQAGVLVGSVSPTGDTLLERRLYWPEEWVTDDAYAARRTPCGMPPESTFKTKPAVAQEMSAAVAKSPGLRCRWVVADEAFGNDTGVLDGVAGLGLWSCAEVPHTTRVWRERRPHPSRRSVGEDAARSGSAWRLAHRRGARCWR